MPLSRLKVLVVLATVLATGTLFSFCSVSLFNLILCLTRGLDSSLNVTLT